MPRYASGHALVDGVQLGAQAGAALTTGTNNVLVGPGAGSALTSGSRNVIIGGASGTPTLSDTVVLSNGNGDVRASWDPNGDVQLRVRDIATVPDPTTTGVMTMGFDVARQTMAFKHHDGTVVRTSMFRTDKEISDLAPLSEVTTVGASLIQDAAQRTIKKLQEGSYISMSTVGDGALSIRCSIPDPITSLDGLSDAVSNENALALGLNARAVNNSVAVGPSAMASATTGVNATAVGTFALASNAGGTDNTAVGANSMQQTTSGSRNTALGANSLRANTTGSDNVALGVACLETGVAGTQNVAAGTQALSRVGTGSGNLAVGFNAGRCIGNGSYNVAVGWQAGDDGGVSTTAPISGSYNIMLGASAGARLQSGGQNVLLGRNAGAQITTGSNNVILGAFQGTAALTNALVLSDGAGNVRLRWDNANNGIHTIDAVEPTLTTDNTMAFVYDSATGGLIVPIRINSTTQTRLELANERRINPVNVTASVTLTAAHRHRLTQVVGSAAIVITVVAYEGIVVGSEHEFFNATLNSVTFVAGSGVVLQSVSSRVVLSTYGAAVLKYLGSNVFALIGSIE